MGEWFIQHESLNELRYPGVFGTSLNPLVDQMNVHDGQSVTSLDEGWEPIPIKSE